MSYIYNRNIDLFFLYTIIIPQSSLCFNPVCPFFAVDLNIKNRDAGPLGPVHSITQQIWPQDPISGLIFVVKKTAIPRKLGLRIMQESEYSLVIIYIMYICIYVYIYIYMYICIYIYVYM